MSILYLSWWWDLVVEASCRFFLSHKWLACFVANHKTKPVFYLKSKQYYIVI